MRLLPLGLWVLAGCGAAPVAPALPDPLVLPATPEGRADACAARAATFPDDDTAQACYREAMTRLGRLPEAIDRLTRAREAQPDDARRWYFEVRARLIADPAGAADLAVQCQQRLPQAPWCQLAEGLAREYGGDLPGALDRVMGAAQALPYAPVLAIQGRLLLSAGRRDAAATQVERALALDDRSAEVLVSAALLAMVDRKQAQAEAHLDRAVALAPDAALPLLTRARVHFLVGDLVGAGVDLRAVLVADPGHVPAREALAQLLLQSGQTEAALVHLNLLVDQHPSRGDLMVQLGEALLARGNGERALGWADLALGNDGSDTDALSLRVRALIRTGAYDEAAALRERLYFHASNARYRLAVARAWGLAHQVTRAEAEFADAITAFPRDPEAWRAYAAWCVEGGRVGKAANVLRRGVEALPRAAALHADLSAIFEKNDHRDEARLAMAQAAKLAPDEPDHQDELARLEFLGRDVDTALLRWQRLLVQHPRADRARLRLSNAYRALGRLSEASAELSTLADLHPEDGTILGQLGEVLVEDARKTEAVPVLRNALARGGDARTLKPLLAAVLADTGAPDEATQAFRSALAEDPANRALRLTYAAFLERHADPGAAAVLYRAQLARDPADSDARARLRALGEVGDGPRWPAASIEPELAALAARVPEAEDASAVLRDERWVTVDADGVAELRHVRSVLIRRASAIEANQEALLGFHSAHEPTVVRGRTLTPDGQSVPLASQEVRNPNVGTALHGDARTLALRFAAVEPGAILDYEVITRRPHPDLHGVWWDGYILGNVEPTVRVLYSLDLPAGVTVQVAAPGMRKPTVHEAQGRRQLTWSREDLPGFNFTNADQVPAVYVSSLRSWRQVDAWYHGLYAEQARPTDTLRAQAKAITAGITDRRAQIAAIYAHVERTVGYLGIEFGIGAYQPRAAETTLATGRGDCKDMTALMAALLAALDIEAWPALVRPREQGPFVEEHPSPGQFSHVVLYVPDPKGDLWLDATAGLGTLGAIPAPLRGQPTLVVDGKGGRRMTLPLGTAATHRMNQHTTWRLTPLGTAQVDGAVEVTGDLAGALRQRLLAVDPAGRQALLLGPGYVLGGELTPETAGVGSLETPDRPLTLTAQVATTQVAQVGPAGLLRVVFQPGFMTEGPLPTLGPEAWFGGPRTFEHQLTLKVPPGYRFEWKPLKTRMTLGGARVTIDEQRTEGQTTLTSRLVLDHGPRDAAARLRLLAELRTTVAGLERDLILVPTHPPDPVHLMKAVAEQRPNDVHALIGYARALVEKNRPVEALEVLKRAVQLAPAQASGQALLAALQLDLGNRRAAVAPLQALSVMPDAEVPVFVMLASIHLEEGEAEAAVDALEAGLKRFPGEAELEHPYIMALARAGHGARAVTQAQRHAARDPSDVERQALLGDLAAEVGQPDVAERAYRAALALQASNSRVLNNLAWLLRDFPARLPEALALAQQATTLDAQSAAAWDTLAELHHRAGHAQEALAALERALALDPAERPRYEALRQKYAGPPRAP